MYIFNEFCYKEIHLINMSPLDHVNWDFGAIRGAFCCCVGSLSSFYTAAGCASTLLDMYIMQMIFQMNRLFKAFLAFFAFIGPLSCMFSHMYLKSGLTA